MNPRILNEQVLTPALQLLGPRFDSTLARVQLVATALQESGPQLRWRIQQPNGPAHSWWMFERGGGVRQLMRNGVTAPHLKRVCDTLCFPFEDAAIYAAMTFSELLAGSMARLLLYALPDALPTTPEDGWRQYLKAWNPGKPHPDVWNDNYAAAAIAVATQE